MIKDFPQSFQNTPTHKKSRHRVYWSKALAYLVTALGTELLLDAEN